MNRRRFLRSGAVLGMAGALIGAGAGKAEAQGQPAPSVPPSMMLDLPDRPAPYTAATTGVTIDPVVQFVPGYDWSKVQGNEMPSIDMTKEAYLTLTVNGEKFQTIAWKPQALSGGPTCPRS